MRDLSAFSRGLYFGLVLEHAPDGIREERDGYNHQQEEQKIDPPFRVSDPLSNDRRSVHSVLACRQSSQAPCYLHALCHRCETGPSRSLPEVIGSPMEWPR